ncbi:DUF1254 domain-containing protein [Streptacidiphilus jiangxiensis]|uniref:Uncharacterized conserved protein n=1 Tax=Streptacidiphilus jiangxiensis TaxID=235985 RepID=A0A1H7PLV2_STRJI|nr:DUF1254 domain-containing protein [Streptacidiphilus jiangxiensis]SEL36245.1 Uncharacterized conserved protein [Streptacidiphilus jiangxiensis]
MTAEAYPDALLTTVVAPGLLADGQEADAYHLGLSAYLWGYPLVRMERVCREYTDVPTPRPTTSYRNPLNTIGWATELATPDAHDMPTANADTLYMSAVVDLTVPYLLQVPDTQDRYYVIDVFTMYQELQHYIGRRTTGTGAGRYVLVPPGWTGPLPADAVRLDVTTRKVWLWGRIRVSAGEDLAEVHALQSRFTLTPSGNAPADGGLAPLPDITGDPLGFYTHLGAALAANPVYPTDQALVAQFTRIGLTPEGFSPSGLTDRQRAALARALADGPAAAQAGFAATAEIRNGWTWVVGMDAFGFDYPRRAVVSGPYLGGNGEREAMYPGGFVDDRGEILDGRHAYRVTFAGPPPVDAFWSLTLYRAADKMLVDNELDRYKVGTDTPGLAVGPDGGITIAVQHARPTDDSLWLPAPAEPFYLILRLYQPTRAILDGTWPLPTITRVE